MVEYGLFCSSTCFRPSPYTPNYPVHAGQVIVNIGLKCAQSQGISKNAIVLSYTQINERLVALKNNSTQYLQVFVPAAYCVFNLLGIVILRPYKVHLMIKMALYYFSACRRPLMFKTFADGCRASVTMEWRQLRCACCSHSCFLD